MYFAQARQQLLHLLHHPPSSRLLQANTLVAALFRSTQTDCIHLVASKLFSTSSQRPSAEGVPWSSSDSSNSSAMASTAEAGTEGYDSQWVEHWKQGVPPGQVRCNCKSIIPTFISLRPIALYDSRS